MWKKDLKEEALVACFLHSRHLCSHMGAQVSATLGDDCRLVAPDSGDISRALGRALKVMASYITKREIMLAGSSWHACRGPSPIAR